MAATLLTALIGLSTWQIWVDRSRTIEAAYSEVELLSRSLEEHTSAVLGHAEGIFDRAATLLGSDLSRSALTAAQIKEFLRLAAQESAAFSSFHLYAADGSPIASSESNLDTARLVYSGASENGPNGTDDLHIGLPLTLADGKIVLPVWKAWRDSAGRVRGSIGAALSLDYFVDFYISFEERSIIVGLLRQDMRILIRVPLVADMLGKSSPSGQRIGEALPTSPTGRFQADINSRRLMRLFAYRQVADRPLVALVGIERDEALAEWKARSWGLAAIVAAASLVVIGLVALLWVPLQRLTLSEDRYARATSRSGMAIWELDFETNRLWTSEQWFAERGLQGENTLQRILDSIHPEDLGITRQYQEALLAGATNAHAEFREYKSNGDIRWVRSVGSAQRDKRGRVIRATGLVYDITERKQFEERITALNMELSRRIDEIHQLNEALEQRVKERTLQLQTRTADLETANRELESFSYSVSHDLRAPLRAIMSFSEILLREHGSALDDEARRVLGVVIDNGTRMTGLIDALLSLARVGQTEVSFAQINMEKLARSAADEILGDAKVELKIGPLPACMGDSALLRQVWINLLGNALKYSSTREHPTIDVSASKEDGLIVYAVKDNGVGFDQQYAEKLFGAFQRLHTDKQFSGSGVGLTIVARVIGKHGGKVWAESAPDRGATFYFSLPCTAPMSTD
ncbi:MAG TPA: ATP-binding protein [Burkholderiales bacterium]|nr:ATP-binding protein [Burkholderiales bacterium]